MRHNPHSGYRAVHVIVESDGFPVEVQIRTQLQHMWAEAFEKLAGVTGRGIQYGDVPDFPGDDGLPVRSEANPVRMLLSSAIDVARFEALVDQHERSLVPLGLRIRDYREEPVFPATGGAGVPSDP